MNMQNLMKQAQAMQKDMMKAKAELDAKVFNGNSSLVELEMNGKKEVVSLKIKNEMGLDEEDLEILEDAIVSALNSTMKDINEENERSMSKFGGGLSGLM